MQATLTEDPRLLEELNAMEAEDLIEWAYANHGERAGLITSFQDTGCVMIDMARSKVPGLRIMTIDTLRLHPETYQLMEQIERKYDLKIERFLPDDEPLDRMVQQHGTYLFFDSKAKQEFCCQIRKVEPNMRALRTVDVWITGLRRDHSSARQTVPKALYVQQEWGPILKLAPLADWEEKRVRAYLEDRDVPHNVLYDQGYTSIGCVICSTPTLPWEDKRAGRWRWFNHTDDEDKECGIHTHGGGI